MIRLQIISMFLIGCICEAYSQMIYGIDDMKLTNVKEIKLYYAPDFLRSHEYYDLNGNNIFSQIYSKDGTILTVSHHQFTESGALKLAIIGNTNINFSMIYWDTSDPMVSRGYRAELKPRHPYIPKMIRCVQEMTSLDAFLNHKRIKKLLRKKGTLHIENYKDEFGNDVKSVSLDKKKKVTSIVTSEFDDKGNCINKMIHDLRGNDKTLRYLYTYDSLGNQITDVSQNNIAKTGEAENWVSTDSSALRYNEDGAIIERQRFEIENSTIRLNYRIVYIYDDQGRIAKEYTYEPFEKLKSEETYRYEKEGVYISRVYHNSYQGHRFYQDEEKFLEVVYYEDQ